MKTLGKILLTLFFVIAIFLTPAFQNSMAENNEPTGSLAVCVSVASDSCIIRESPKPDSGILYRGENGQVFQVVARFGHMIGVQLDSDQIGYILLEDVQLAELGEASEQQAPLSSSFTSLTLVGSDNSDDSIFSLGASIASLTNTTPKQTVSETHIDPDQPNTGIVQVTSDEESQVKDSVLIDPEPNDHETEVSIPLAESSPDQITKDTQQPVTSPEEDLDTDESIAVPAPVEAKTEDETQVESQPEYAPPEVVAEEADESDITDMYQPVTMQTPSLNSEENIMYQLICKLRASKELNPLELDTALIDVARTKTRELIDLDYFSHTSPVYGSPQDMLRYFSISYDYMGENIGLNTNVKEAYNAFINSPLHLDNILNPDFTHIGIGVEDKNSKQIIVTLVFIESSK